jgi:hypothetical protein
MRCKAGKLLKRLVDYLNRIGAEKGLAGREQTENFVRKTGRKEV